MKLIRGLASIPKVPKHSAVALGHFRSLHRGHYHLLQALVERARSLDTCSCVLLAADEYQALWPVREQLSIFSDLGVDVVVYLRRTEVSSLLQQSNLINLLCSKLQARLLCCSWQVTLLARPLFDPHHASTVEIVHCYGPRIDERHLEQCLQHHAFAAVQEMLGRRYRLSGQVVHGDKRGRVLGFPTANVNLKRFKPPIAGVFAVRIAIDGVTLNGVANLGYRPSVDGNVLRFEVHVFDFDGDLYGQYVHVYPYHKIRDEHQFQTLSALQNQINADVVAAQNWFAANACLDEKLKTDDERL